MKFNLKDLKYNFKNGLKKYWWIIAIAIFIKLTQPDLSFKLGTQSIFGTFGTIGLSAGILMVIASFVVVLIPGGVLLATPLFFTGLILSGGSVLALITQLFEYISTLGTPIIVIGVVMVLYFISRILRR